MPYTKGLYEVIDECRKTKNVKIKAEILRNNESTALIDLLQLTYNPSIQWLLPEGDPPYRPTEETELEGALIGKMRMMKYFISVNGQVLENIHPAKREVVFIQMLESIAAKDAKLVIEAKNRNIKGVSKTVVKEAFPQIEVGDK